MPGKSKARDKASRNKAKNTRPQHGQRQESEANKAKMDTCISFSFLETLIFTTKLSEIQLLYLDLVENEADLYATSLQVIINGVDLRERFKPEQVY